MGNKRQSVRSQLQIATARAESAERAAGRLTAERDKLKSRIAPVQLFARPRDTDESKRKPGERTLETYRVTGPWVVECYDSTGAWLWTHYGTCNMTRAQAKKLARDWFKPSKAKAREKPCAP